MQQLRHGIVMGTGRTVVIRSLTLSIMRTAITDTIEAIPRQEALLLPLRQGTIHIIILPHPLSTGPMKVPITTMDRHVPKEMGWNNLECLGVSRTARTHTNKMVMYLLLLAVLTIMVQAIEMHATLREVTLQLARASPKIRGREIH